MAVKLNGIDQAIEEIKTEILAKEKELSPLRERVMEKERDIFALRSKVVALDNAKKIINGETVLTPQARGGWNIKRTKNGDASNPYGGFDYHRLEGLTVRQACMELAKAAGGVLACKFAAELMFKAGIVRNALAGNSAAYAVGTQSTEFTKTGPGRFTLTAYKTAGS